MLLYCLTQFFDLNLISTENRPKNVYFQKPIRNSGNLEEISKKPVAILIFLLP